MSKMQTKNDLCITDFTDDLERKVVWKQIKKKLAKFIDIRHYID